MIKQVLLGPAFEIFRQQKKLESALMASKDSQQHLEEEEMKGESRSQRQSISSRSSSSSPSSTLARLNFQPKMLRSFSGKLALLKIKRQRPRQRAPNILVVIQEDEDSKKEQDSWFEESQKANIREGSVGS